MRKLTILLLMILSATMLQAQRGQRAERMKEIKKEVIKERLGLSDAEFDKFWGVYERYDSEKRQNNKQIQALKRGFSAQSDQQLEGSMNRFFQLKQSQLDIEKKYYREFQKVISVRQIAVLYQVEKEIKKRILAEMQRRRGGGGGGGKMGNR